MKKLMLTLLMIGFGAANALAQEERQSSAPAPEQKPASAQPTNPSATASDSSKQQGHSAKVTQQDLQRNVGKLNRASNFIGMQVKNLSDETLGKIEELVLDYKNGKVAYAVLSVGGFLGVNEKFMAVPLTALTPAPGEGHLLLNASKQSLEQAKGFRKNDWPDLDAQIWGSGNDFRLGPTVAKDKTEEPSADDGDETVTGRVASVQPQARKVVIESKKGRQEFSVPENAQIHVSGNSSAKLEELKPGSTVSIRYEKKGENSFTAKSIKPTTQEEK